MSSLEDILKDANAHPTGFGYLASDIDVESIDPIIVADLIRDEIPTLNKFGYMKIDLDEISQDFVNHAEKSKVLKLDLGTAFGFVTKKVLEKGGQIIANDISYDHLGILLKSTPKEQLKDLYIYPGKFPEEVDLPPKSMKAIYTARMLHFLNKEEIDLGFKKIHSWLEDDGKFYFISVTPYHANIREKFQHVYESRLDKGEMWPGLIDSQWEINPGQKEDVPEFLHVFEVKALQKLMPKYGFEIERIELFDYINDVDSDGKGHVGLIARKKQNVELI